ncbi:MAG: hypothetical protein JTT12_07590, partial [Candidatus Brockarchaeota archaeon]|nr:hypothetical protein [Candidatus Brockarchaeota archaeon]
REQSTSRVLFSASEMCNIILDRDVVAVLNLQMRGEGFTQRALNEIIEREGLSRNETSSIST